MVYGQGKDLQANFRDQNNFGEGSNSLIRMAGNIIGTARAALDENPEAAVQYGTDLIGEVQNFKSIFMGSKNSSDNKKYNNIGQSQPINQQSPISTQAAQANLQGTPKQYFQSPLTNAASRSLISGGYDTGAGYNPQSETFHDGQGNLYMDQRPTFDQQVAQQPVQNLNPNLTLSKQVPMALIGSKLNYFTYSI